MNNNKLFTFLTCLTATLAIQGNAQQPLLHAPASKSHAFIWDSTRGMRDLGTLGGENSYALGINGRGVVVGYSYLSDNITIHAFRWTQAEGMVDLTPYFSLGRSSQANFININGTVAGTAILTTGLHEPALFGQDRWMHLPLGSGNQDKNYGFSVNDSNQVTGQFYTGSTVNGYLWDTSAATFAYLPVLPGGVHTVGTSINNFTHIAGTGSLADGSFDALLWTASTGSQDIGSLNGSGYTAAQGINDNDELVGLNSPELAGFYWSSATGLVELQTLGGTTAPAFGINNAGMIVGYSSRSDGTVHATRWDSYTTSPQDLGALNLHGNSYGRGINSTGQVVGYADAR